MRIYFAGSIRAGREDVELYNKIIAHLKQYGDVLTEHVGDYSLSVEGQNQLPDKYIHDRDLEWLLSSDIVVAEVTVPSLGVGYEIGVAVREKIPVISLFRKNKGRQLSAMIAGSEGIDTIDYSELETVLPKIDAMIKVILCKKM
ncbi:MAG: nucleoside 2-deoxyribosyltransferase [Lutisporaceae bacterium]